MSVLVASALDLGLAEPPVRVHPVVWIGRYLGLAERVVPAAPRGRSLAAGALAWLGGATAAALTAVGVEQAAARLGRPWGALLRGLVLWPLLSARLLFSEVTAVESALSSGTASGRTALSRIVSRDTDDLTDEEVRGAAVESLAENLSDSLVGPLFWYLVAGLPGAAVYRFANTADACWGYLTPRWCHAGRATALADDVLNIVPARLTAALLLGGTNAAVRAEADKTRSPNAGWPMAAMALRLDLRLSKHDHYDLNPFGSSPGPGAVPAAVRTARRTAFLAVALAAVGDVMISRHRGARR
ncbi:MAG: adenosylcobinamide-phosphate synthase CbiB [Actinomycetota bacterium]|nr:adenosylcobinamide-phosphate synthase CbiB [Actinomycetota bacterium]